MKAISLHQPWATLVVIGAKCVETRPRRFHYRGPLLIHAAKKMPAYARACAVQEPFKSALKGFYDLPRGAIIGFVNVTDDLPVEVVDWIDAEERAFGDYSSGRRAIILCDPVMFARPIPFRGSQAMPFNVPDALLLDYDLV